ncbi:hypothetical protein M422DRAFT_776193 [Sphaerobolus stellatus SS14]|nr:hypothetical protein M422DRAFT_776193 [Sphaerobolus stellatus SS14]
MSDLGLTMGVALVGTLISAVLYGITVTQTYLYFQRFPQDNILIKLMVAVLWTLDTLHLALISHSMYFYLIQNFNHPDALASAVWSFNSEVSVNGLIGLIVECFFARRMLRLSGGSRIGWFLAVIVCILSLIHFGLGIFFTDRLFQLRFFAKFPELTLPVDHENRPWKCCSLRFDCGPGTLLVPVYLPNRVSQDGLAHRNADGIHSQLWLADRCLCLYGHYHGNLLSLYNNNRIYVLNLAVLRITEYLILHGLLLGARKMLNSREALRGKLGYVAGTNITNITNISDNQPSKHSIMSSHRNQRSSAAYGEPNFEILYARPPSPQPALTVRVDTTTETNREYYRHSAITMPKRTASMISIDRPEDQITALSLAPSPSSTVPLIGNPRDVPKFP